MFPHATVSGLDVPTQRLLVRRWFRLLADDPAGGHARAERLQTDLRARPELDPLSSNPLLLTATCIIYSQGNQLPQHKHELYGRIVETVLRNRFQPEDIAAVRNELAVIAYAMHTGQGLDEVRDVPASQTTNSEIGRVLEGYQQTSVRFESGFRAVDAARDRLLSDSGLLLPTETNQAAFYHLSLQEFLAAEWLAEVERDRLLGVFRARAPRPEWRNTLSFLYGSLLKDNVPPRRAAELLVRLLGALSTSASQSEVLIGLDCIEILLGRSVTLRGEILAAFQAACLQLMMGTQAPSERLRFGRALGIAGDPRFSADAWSLPAEPLLGFIEIPAGEFCMGSEMTTDVYAYVQERPAHTVVLPQFYISRYPVTVAQWHEFVSDDTAFDPVNRDGLRRIANRPVAQVSWREALAYCDWLTEKLRAWDKTPRLLRDLLLGDGDRPAWRVTLPSEAQWEKAARGTQGRIYPWGNESDGNKANYRDTNIGDGATSVGCFPDGISPFGVVDMCGNVWEWTRSKSGYYPYEPGGFRESLTAHARRVVRGGSFDQSAWIVRAAYRHALAPDDHECNVGFRVVIGPAASESDV